MTSIEIESLIEERRRTEKIRKKNQLPYAVMVLIFASILAILLWKTNHSYLVFWAAGIAFGIVLRYSRFCLAGAFRDPILIRNTRLMRALLLAFMVSTVGFAIIQYGYLKNNRIDYSLIPGALNPVGLHTVIGAFIFGVGMTIAGGCASGVLMRIGEGHVLPWVTLLGFFIGTTLGAENYSFWNDKIISKTKVVYFPEHMDLVYVAAIQMIVLIGLYKLALRYEKRNIKR